MRNGKNLSSVAEVAEHTTILDEEQLGDYPYCLLPPHFFERVMYLKRKAAVTELHHTRTILSVQTLDGRDVMSVLSE
jgi:hypothetical protein